MTYSEVIKPAVPKHRSEGRSVINPNGPCGSHFGFKNFQLEDYACGALYDGLVLGHDTGGGKSFALFTWPALKIGFQRDGQSGSDFAPGEYGPSGSDRALRPLGPVLLVVPGELHHKTIAEVAVLMKAKVIPTNCQDDFLRLP